jgi:hypothetical protein
MIKFPSLEDLNNGAKRNQQYIHKHYPEFENYLLSHFDFVGSWIEKLYCYFYKIDKTPLCPVCGNSVKFTSFIKGYHEFCSVKCLSNSTTTINKRKKTCLKKYGVEHATQSEEIQNKVKRTNLERYGVEYPAQSQEFQNKMKQTCLEKYGVEHPLQSQNIQNKYKQTCLEKYGVENPFQSQERISRHDEIINKAEQTCLKRYGVEYPIQSQNIQNKYKQTCLEKYGFEYASQSEEFLNKVKQTCLDKYGVKHYNQSDEGRARLSEKHSSEEVQNKTKQTCLDKYGVEYYFQSKEYQSKHDEIQAKMNNTKHLNRTFNSSEIENLFSNYLDSQNIEYKRQYRSKEYPFNCDFYLPRCDLYVEIQAGWFHGGHPYNEKSDKYTLEKWKSKNTDFYKTAIETWTERDPKKREIARQNQLNYLEVFSNNIDKAIETFENFIHNPK